jgi:hypothetical protein
MTKSFASFWRENFSEAMREDELSSHEMWINAGDDKPWGHLSQEWDGAVPLRLAAKRRQAMLEIDVLMAMSLGLSVDELVTIYRTQFPVMRRYEKEARLLDNGHIKYASDDDSADETRLDPSSSVRPITQPSEENGKPLDREGDYVTAYEHFKQRLGL